MKPIQYRNQNWEWFRILDLMVILALLMNFGAYSITNALIIKAEPELPVFEEANPVMAKINGWQLAAGFTLAYAKLLFPAIVWSFLIIVYLVNRNKIINLRKLYFLTAMIVFYFVLLGMDFFGNLGYLIGVGLYG